MVSLVQMHHLLVLLLQEDGDRTAFCPSVRRFDVARELQWSGRKETSSCTRSSSMRRLKLKAIQCDLGGWYVSRLYPASSLSCGACSPPRLQTIGLLQEQPAALIPKRLPQGVWYTPNRIKDSFRRI